MDLEAKLSLERDPRRNRNFRKAPTEQIRVDRLLKHCASRLRPSYEKALKKIQQQPDWRERFTGVENLIGVEKLLKEDMGANPDQEPLTNTTTTDIHLSQASILTTRDIPLEELESLFANCSPLPAAEDSEEAPISIPGEEKESLINTPKKMITARIPADLLERVKNAVYYTPGLTMSDFAENAFLKALKELEENRGEAFPQRAGNIRKGRPIR